MWLVSPSLIWPSQSYGLCCADSVDSRCSVLSPFQASEFHPGMVHYPVRRVYRKLWPQAVHHGYKAPDIDFLVQDGNAEHPRYSHKYNRWSGVMKKRTKTLTTFVYGES
jgi:hypothetical protein